MGGEGTGKGGGSVERGDGRRLPPHALHRSPERGNVRGVAGKAALRGIWGLAPTREMLEKIGLDSLPVPRNHRKG